MMTGRLSLQIMDDQLVAGLLQVRAATRPPMMPNPINPTTTSFLVILNLISGFWTNTAPRACGSLLLFQPAWRL